MTYMELIDELKSIKKTTFIQGASFPAKKSVPVTYESFKSAQKPPFITVQFFDNDDLMADNCNYVDIEGYQIELYTAKKHPPTEKLVQKKLKELRLPYNKVEDFLKGEGLYQIIYEIQLI